MTVDDFPLVAGWLADPEIERWWDVDADVDAVAQRYGPAVAGNEPTTYVVVLVDGRPAGFGQHYLLADHPRWDAGIGMPGVTGIDYALADGYRGRGIGPLLVDALATASLVAHPDATGVTAAPVVANARSCRTLEIAGFGFVRLFDADEGPARLYHRPREVVGLSASLRTTHAWFAVNSGWAPPPPETMADWLADGVCRAPDDCWTTPHRPCSHGLASWHTVLRYNG